MKSMHYAAACVTAVAIGTSLAFAQGAKGLPDVVQKINGIDTACTGASSEAREEAKWAEYPFRLEFVGKDGQFLGDEMVTVRGNGVDVMVHCEGPWVLMKLPKGSYQVTMDVAEGGHRTMTMSSPGRTVMRFPDAGGAADKERPKL